MAPATFTCFPQLPPELRLEIWKLCLPARVIEVDIPGNCINGIRCKFYNTSWQNKRPPVIAHVCRESRQLAYNTGGYQKIHEKGVPDWTGNNVVRKAWFDPTVDILHLHWDGRYGWELEYQQEGDPISYFLWRLKQNGSSPNFINASIMADVLFPFEPLPDWKKQLARWNPNSLKEWKHYLAIVKVVCLHVTLEQALRAELFGRLGEEHVKLVDLGDRIRIRQYYDLYLQGPQAQEDAQPQEAFNMLLDEQLSNELAAQWRENVRNLWVVNELINDLEAHIQPPTDLLDSLENGETIQELYNGWDHEDVHYTWGLDPSKHIPKRDHPWTQERLACIPDCRLMVMFRLCLQQCHKFPPRGGWDSDLEW